MNYFECEYDACGKDKAGVLAIHGECQILGVLNGPFEPSGKIVDRFQGVLRVTIYGPGAVKAKAGVAQEYLAEMFAQVVKLREYPRCVLDVKLYVLRHRENLLSACINAMAALLLGAGILTVGVPLGVHVKQDTSEYTVGALFTGTKMVKLLYVGSEEEPAALPEKALSDLLERMKYSLKTNYQQIFTPAS